MATFPESDQIVRGPSRIRLERDRQCDHEMVRPGTIAKRPWLRIVWPKGSRSSWRAPWPFAQDAAAWADCADPPGLSPPVGLRRLTNIALATASSIRRANKSQSWGLAGRERFIIPPYRLASLRPRGGWSARPPRQPPATARKRTLDAIGVTLLYGAEANNRFLHFWPKRGSFRLDRPCRFRPAPTRSRCSRTDPSTTNHKGLSGFIVPKPRGDGHGFALVQDAGADGDAPGGARLVGRAIDTIGYRGMHSYEIAFDNWWVAHDNLIGTDSGIGRGFYFQMEGFENGRLQTAARAVGLMQAAYEAARLRGQPRRVRCPHRRLPTHPGQARPHVVSHPAGTPVLVPRVRTDVPRRRDARSIDGEGLRVRAAEWVTREALQIHGGMGYAEEYAVSRYYVDARVLSIFEGADETLCLKVIARKLVAGLERVSGEPGEQLAQVLDAVEVGSGMIGVGVDQHGVQPGRPGAADVHLHRVADVHDP